MTDKFMEYMMEVENAPLKSTGDKKYVVHRSPEGGLDTVGYGHKLNVLEKTNNQVYGYTIDEIDEPISRIILARDLQRFESSLSKLVPSWTKLPKRSQEMLIDFQFNLGNVIDKFPKFYAAVLRNDIPVQKKEYKRYYTDEEGETRPLKDRNEKFYRRYLSPLAVQAWS